MRACSRCGKEAVTYLAYRGDHLCSAHFRGFVERRVRREVREQGRIPRGSRVAVGVSGGKDSVTTLRLLHGILAPRRDVTLVAVTVDEGIAAYRPAGIDIARRTAEELGVAWSLVTYREEAGLTLDEIVARKTEGLPCTFCGPLRRRSLNRAAREAGASHLATGHNLDDVAQSVLMNTLRGDLGRMARLAPHAAPATGPRGAPDGLVPRLLPLRSLPEREVALYAILNGWEYHDGECPYAAGATRGRIRDMLLALEEAEPGTRHALASGGARLAIALRAAAPADAPRAATCASCGEPCASRATICRGCEMIAALPR